MKKITSMYLERVVLHIYYYCVLNLIIIIIICHFLLIKRNTTSNYQTIFNLEESLFLDDKIVYANFLNITHINDIYKLRKISKYKKKGYSGHPIRYTFSLPLDDFLILYPYTTNIFYELIIFIHCRPEEFYERFVYRKCYIQSKDFIVIYITSKSISEDVNKKLEYEAKLYKDILQFNEIASYFNLSIQTVHMLKWSLTLRYKYLLKSDIDVYINIPFLLKWLRDFKTIIKLYALGKISHAYVLRNKKYSHYVPKDIIPQPLYPPYLQGVGYLMPFNTVKLISKTIVFVNPKIWIEDVFVGYLLKYNNISLINISKYILRDIPANISDIINNINKYMLIHELYPYELYLLVNKCKFFN